MARKRVIEEPALHSWQEVDGALRHIAECQRLTDEQELELNRQINELKERAEAMSRPVWERIRALEREVKRYVEEHRDELGGKTRQLTFGRTGYRISSKLVVPNAAEVLEKLKRLGLAGCITVKETVNKDALRQQPVAKILEAGAYLRQSDEFWYEVDYTALGDPEQ